MPNFLRNLKFRAIALVDKGANQRADIVLLKRDATADLATNQVVNVTPNTGAVPMAEEQDVRETHDELQKQAVEQLTELRKLFEEERAEKKALAEKVAKLEDDQERGEYIAKCAEFSGLPGLTADDFAPILRKMYGPLTVEERARVDGIFKGAAEAIKTSRIYSELGVSNAPPSPDSAMGRLERLVEAERQKDGKLTKAAAMADVLKTAEGKRLYGEYQKEQHEAARRVR